MLNLRLLVNFLTVLFLIFLQTLVFDKISFEQVATPYIYVLFPILYHPDKNRYLFLILCFLLGWGVDWFENTGGIHAFATLTIGLLNQPMIKLISGTKFFEAEEFRFSDFNVGQWFVYTLFMVLIHHFILFFFESFSFSNFNEILLRTLYCSIFTLIFVYFYLILFRKKAER